MKIFIKLLLLLILLPNISDASSGFFVCKIVGGMPSGVVESGYIGFYEEFVKGFTEV